MIRPNSTILLFISLILGFGLLFFLYTRVQQFEKERALEQYMDSLLTELSEKIEEKEQLTLTASTILSKSPFVIECLKKSEPDLCRQRLTEIKTATGAGIKNDTLRIHIHTAQLTSFIRLFEETFIRQDPLNAFRISLNRIKETQQSETGIEIGRYSMRIRGIAPIFTQEGETTRYLGSIETMVGYESITRYFQRRGIQFYVLMSTEFKDLVNLKTYTRRHQVGKYVIINDNLQESYQLLEASLKETGYAILSGHVILHTPIVDINDRRIGYYVFRWPME